MAKKPQTPGKALGGGSACFREDGTFTKNACDALRTAAKKLAATSSKITSTTEDRDAWLKEFPTIKSQTEKKDRAVQIVEAIASLKLLRAEKIKMGGTLGRIVAGIDAGQFNVEMSPKEIIDQAREGGGREDDDEEDGEGGEDEKPTDQQNLKFTGHGDASAGHGWHDQWKAYPAVWGEREWPVVNAHISKVHDLKAGTMVVGTPAAFARFLRVSFEKLKTTEDRRGILPAAPEWFWDGIMELVARHAACELYGRGEASSEKVAAEMLEDLQKAADKDVDAWLHLVGGKGSLLNHTINNTAKAAV